MLSAADMVVLGVLLLSGLLGLWRGFVTEVLSLTSWMLAFWVALVFGAEVSAWMPAWMGSALVRTASGHVAAFLAVLTLGGLVTWLFARLVRATGLSGTDRLLGFGFGLVRGVALCVLGILLLGFTPLPQHGEWERSTLIRVLQPGALWLAAWLPESVQTQLRLQSPPAPTPPPSD